MSKFITCVQTGASSCQPRHDEYGPSMKAWRCDLTALSQVHNLYFVACSDTILVYQPEFPDQRLSEPKLVLHPPVSSPDLEPYVDPQDPHSITRLLVDYLGNDEILLATCDDGDVIGYRAGEIQRVLDLAQQSSDEEEEPDFAAHVRVFLHQNVGLSAWGLAIHREARIIAISANTHEITVLAFALASGDASSESSFLDTIMGADFPSPRRRNHVFTLRAGHNVPSVSFNNNEEDPDGRWLFATCITGETTLWDLHNTDAPARALRMGWCRSTSSPYVAPPPTLGGCECVGARGHPHATWNATFLDPRSAHEVSPSECEWTIASDAPFFDDAKAQKERFESREMGPGGAPDASGLEVSQLAATIPMDPNGVLAMELVALGHVNTTEEAMMIVEGASGYSESDSSSDAMSVDQEPNTVPQDADPADSSHQSEADDGMDQEQETQASTAPALPPIQTHLTDYADVVMSQSQPVQPTFMPFAITGFPQFELSLEEVAHLMQGSHEEDSDEIEDDDDLLYMPAQFDTRFGPRRGIVQPPAYCEIKDGPSFKGCNNHQPCLIVSKDDIFLLQSPLNKIDDQPEYMLAKRRAAGDEPDHTLVMRQPLHTGPWRPNPVSADRLCFSTQIPELGIFIVASPSGRAAIFALTRSHDASKGFTYGFHLEYILPFVRGNENVVIGQHQSQKRLVGVAVGPIQGMLGRDSGSDRMWRLMMYFTSHEVMSFELKRKRAEGTPGLGDLVV